MNEPGRKRERKRRSAAEAPLTDEDGEVRELTLADIRRMRPVRDVLPELIEAAAEFRKKAGRPKAEAPKVHIGFRLSADLVERIRASGPGYNARVEEALRNGFMERGLRDDEAKAVVAPDGAPRKRRA